jgi:hypothetical protein
MNDQLENASMPIENRINPLFVAAGEKNHALRLAKPDAYPLLSAHIICGEADHQLASWYTR